MKYKVLATILALVLLTLLSPYAFAEPIYKTLYVFTGGHAGSGPNGGLVMDKFGNLYGTTSNGGNECLIGKIFSANGCGIAFQLVPVKHQRDSFTFMEADSAKSPVVWQENVIYSFHGDDGASPAALVIDNHGDLFGTTQLGGSGDCASHGCGIAFQLSRQGNDRWTERVIGRFTDGHGVMPMAPLTFDSEGNLYGTTSDFFSFMGPGTVFKLTPGRHGDWTSTVLYTFDVFDGLTPMSAVIFDPEGNLYGTTLYGGQYLQGNVYRLSPNSDGTWTDTVLRTFTDDIFDELDASYPQGGLVRDTSGNLFGTTVYGGTNPGGPGTNLGGTAYELKPNSDGTWTFRTIHYFGGGMDGLRPHANLVMDETSALYGMTAEGGAYSCGVVFKLTPEGNDNWREDILHTFDGTYGCASPGPLFMDSNGNLYGTTSGDGTTTFGSVFEITP